MTSGVAVSSAIVDRARQLHGSPTSTKRLLGYMGVTKKLFKEFRVIVSDSAVRDWIKGRRRKPGMSRSGYSTDLTNWSMICWRGAVANAIRGQRGQAFLREMLEALDAMPVKRLIAEELAAGGDVCAMGAVASKRGLDCTHIDPEDRDQVASALGIAGALAAEIAFENDEGGTYWRRETPEERWVRMRAWVVDKIGRLYL